MPSTLIDSQFATLESPVGEPLTLALDASSYSVDELAAQAHRWWLDHGLKLAS
jgi:gluconokinase